MAPLCLSWVNVTSREASEAPSEVSYWQAAAATAPRGCRWHLPCPRAQINTPSRSQPLPATPSHPQPLSATSGHSQLLSATPSHSQPQSTPKHSTARPATFGGRNPWRSSQRQVPGRLGQYDKPESARQGSRGTGIASQAPLRLLALRAALYPCLAVASPPLARRRTPCRQATALQRRGPPLARRRTPSLARQVDACCRVPSPAATRPAPLPQAFALA